MRVIPRHPLLLLALLMAPLRAQTHCQTLNDMAASGYASALVQGVFTDWAFALVAPQPLAVTSLECDLRGSEPVGIALWSSVGGQPGAVLAGGVVELAPGRGGSYGVGFDRSVTLAANQPFFVVVSSSGRLAPLLEFGDAGASAAHPPGFAFWFERGAWYPTPEWVAPILRLRCGLRGGLVTGFGSASPGDPVALWGSGLPVLAQTPVLTLTAPTLPTLPALLLWGARADLPLPFGRLYVDPILWLTFGASGPGRVDTPVAIPTDPSLIGVEVAFQSWLIDLALVAPRAHSNGVAFRLGG